MEPDRTVHLELDAPTNENKDLVSLKLDRTLNATQVEELIAMLAKLRATMAPIVPNNISKLRTHDHGQPSRAGMEDHASLLFRVTETADVLICLRHPGIGWLLRPQTLEQAQCFWEELTDIIMRKSNEAEVAEFSTMH